MKYDTSFLLGECISILEFVNSLLCFSRYEDISTAAMCVLHQ